MQILLYAAACLLVLTIPQQAKAQTIIRADSMTVMAAVATASQLYVKQVQPESVLFNGPEYVNRTLSSTIGHQFFLNAEPQLGDITYRGAQFKGVLLSYDLALGQVVLTYPGPPVTITLVPEQVTNFSLGDHSFVRLLADSAAKSAAPTGFYEVLLPGPVSLLAHRTKRLEETTVQQSLKLEFRQNDQLFVRTASTVAPANNLKEVLALLPSHKAEVQRYARRQKLRFSTAQRENSALKTLQYYYSLPQ
jgi:hypothetical protein